MSLVTTTHQLQYPITELGIKKGGYLYHQSNSKQTKLIMLHDSAAFTITLDLFTVSLLLAGILFCFTLILAKRKYTFLRRSNPSFDLKKLLVLSAGTVCFLRIMSFVGVIAMDLANVRAHYSLNKTSSSSQQDGEQPIEANQAFYDNSMAVLFDLPNAIVVSTYILLTLVWAECSLLSRFHTESSIAWRKRWLVWYMIFNSCLYATQVILYILIFAGGIRSRGVVVVRSIVTVAMSGINLCAVFLVFVLYIYLSVKFSGFPYRSQQSKESLRKITNVVLFWSVTRIIWGISSLIFYIHDVDLLRPQAGWLPIVLFLLLLLTEILPIIILMDYSFMTMVGFQDSATREMTSLATGQHVLTSNNGIVEDEGDEEVSIPPPESFHDSLSDPLLGQQVS